MWRSIHDGGVYEVSNKGRVRHGITRDIRKLQLKGDKKDKHGTNIKVNGKDIPLNISRVVLETFVRKPLGTEHAGHKNGIRNDNRVENLEWRSGATYKQKTTPVIVTRESTEETIRFDSPKEAAAYIGKSRTAIFHNFGKEFVNGFKVERVVPGVINDYELDGPGEDVVEKEIKLGDKVVKVSANGWVKPGDGRWKKVTAVREGYLRTSFQFDRDGNTKRNSAGEVLSKWFDLHRLVCEAFHGPPPVENDAHHINEVKTDNRPENLEWRSRSSNLKVSYELGFNVSTNEMSVYQYDIGGKFTGKVFKSASEAARRVNGDVGGISMCCNGKRNSHKNFEWSSMKPEEYAVERGVMQARVKESNKEIVTKRREKNGPPKSTGKPIYAYDAVTFELKGSWPSGKAAAEVTKCNKANISNCVNGKLEQTGGFIFSRKDEEAFRAEREAKEDEVIVF